MMETPFLYKKKGFGRGGGGVLRSGGGNEREDNSWKKIGGKGREGKKTDFDRKKIECLKRVEHKGSI